MYVTDVPVWVRLTDPAVEALVKRAQHSAPSKQRSAAREALERLSATL